ncbi:MAG: MMPL family transporter [Myxococcota bacterium]|nr:MMPL family transporter [Myxococcota bacterium]
MKLSDAAARLGQLQVKRPWYFLAGGLVLTVIAAGVASGMVFDASYEALLPKGASEVENADAVRERTGGTRQIVLAIGGGKTMDARLAFGRELAQHIEKIKVIRSVDFELPAQFFVDRGLWLMDTPTLTDLTRAVKHAVETAKWQANPMHLHLDAAAEKAELEAAWKAVDTIVETERGKLPFDKVLVSKDGNYVFMLVVPAIKFSDMTAGQALLTAIKREVDRLAPEKVGIHVKTAGNLDIIQEQHHTMTRDLRNASILALVLGTIVVAVFTRSLLAPVIIGLPLVAGVVWTFAMARVIIGQLNIITGFLVAVLIGLGIDFGVHIFIRFQQERRRQGVDGPGAVIRAVSGTLPPALTSALTTAGTFVSFVIADFRGFSEFGLIAGIGVIFTLTASFALLPALLMVMAAGKEKRVDQVQSSNIHATARVPSRTALITVICIGAVAVFGIASVGKIPFKNDFRFLRGASPATRFLDYVNANLGIEFNPAVVIADTLEDAAVIADMAKTQQQAGLPDGTNSRIGRVFAIGDLMPNTSNEARTHIAELRAVLSDPKLNQVEEKEGNRARQLAQARKMVQTEPWGLEDIPTSLRRRMTTRDGEGFIVYIWPNESNDADYKAAAWEDELTALSKKISAAGISHDMADETLIIAWIYRLILADGGPLLIMAIAVVFIFLLFDFRSIRQTAIAALPLGIGMGVFVAIMRAWDMELNMFNLIVVPSIIGIGIDNAVHIYHRYRDEGPGEILTVIRTTGMAALLASLTTGIGFGSSLISHNQGLKSLGMLAIWGIGSTFIAAVVFFPCALLLLERHGRKK